MHITAISSVTDLLGGHDRQTTAQPAVKPLPEYRAVRADRATGVDRTIVRMCTITIAVVLDVTCILWVWPLANQLAETAGVSMLEAIHVGLAAMLCSIPIVVAATIFGCRALLRVRG